MRTQNSQCMETCLLSTPTQTITSRKPNQGIFPRKALRLGLSTRVMNSCIVGNFPRQAPCLGLLTRVTDPCIIGIFPRQAPCLGLLTRVTHIISHTFDIRMDFRF